MISRRNLPAAIVASLCLMATTATAQVQPGQCALTHPGAGSLGGIMVLDTWVPGVPEIPVTGLPPGLTGATTRGCVSVAIDSDGNLAAGEMAEIGNDTYVHKLTLAGTAVVADDAYFVAGGTNSDYSAVVDIEPFGDDFLILCSTAHATTGPMAGHVLGLFRPNLGPPGTPGTIVPIPITGLPFGRPTAIAIDAEAGFVYLVQENYIYISNVWRFPLPLPTGGAAIAATTPWVVLNAGAALQSVVIGQSNEVFVSTHHQSMQLEEVGGQVVQTGVYVGGSDMAFVPATGERLIIRIGSNLFSSITTTTNTGLAFLSGGRRLDYRPSMEIYGAGNTPSTNAYQWALGPNPGGLPSIGNASFSITIEQPPTAVIGVAVLALGEATTPIPALGITLLLDPASAVAVPGALPGGASATISLAIPPQPSLLGTSVHAQTVHWEGSSWAASPGLRIHLVP